MSRRILVDSFAEVRAAGDARWVVPVMAVLFDEQGAKFVRLWRGLGASQGGVRAALEAAIRCGWVVRNPGYGHPMRPEYVLTKKGQAAGEACSQIMKGLDGAPWKDLTKWSLAVIYVLRFGPYRFNQLAAVMEGITDRALVMCLKPLVAHGLVLREVDDSFPPSVTYSLTPSGETVLRPIARLAKSMRARTGRV
jgi:DNA-binding HxlR family transcriptional regulator